MIAFSRSSFAIQSLVTAPGIGQWKSDIALFYGGVHWAPNLNGDDPTVNDQISQGIRWQYGIFSDLDLVISYSQDTLVRLKDYYKYQFNATQLSGSTTMYVIKKTMFSEAEGSPIDFAMAWGYGNVLNSIKFSSDSPAVNRSVNSLSGDEFVGLMFSKKKGEQDYYCNLSGNVYTNYQTVWTDEDVTVVTLLSAGITTKIFDGVIGMAEYDYGIAEQGAGRFRQAYPYNPGGNIDKYNVAISGLTFALGTRF